MFFLLPKLSSEKKPDRFAKELSIGIDQGLNNVRQLDKKPADVEDKLAKNNGRWSRRIDLKLVVKILLVIAVKNLNTNALRKKVINVNLILINLMVNLLSQLKEEKKRFFC